MDEIICTLGAEQLEGRRLEWSDVSSLALDTETLPTGVAFEVDPADADVVADLVGRELECCGSWLDIATASTTDGRLRVTITTDNPDGVDLIRSLAGAGAAG